eukprot:3349207-Rhodomonas_salina.1
MPSRLNADRTGCRRASMADETASVASVKQTDDCTGCRRRELCSPVAGQPVGSDSDCVTCSFIGGQDMVADAFTCQP